MRKWSLQVMTLLLLSVLVLTACVAPAAPAAPAADSGAAAEAPSADGPSMALVLIGPKDDNSWAEAAYNALQAQAEKGVKVAFSESVSDADVARVMRD